MKETVLITGASGGIGSAIALELASCGYDIAVHYYQAQEKAEQLKEQIISKYGVQCMTVQADVAKE